jgi:hypothetical protein
LLKSGYTALIEASANGHEETVCTLLEYEADVNTKDNVRNQIMIMMMMMMMTMMITVLTIMMSCRRIDTIVDNDDRRSTINFL